MADHDHTECRVLDAGCSLVAAYRAVAEAAQRRRAAQEHLTRYLHNDGTDDADCRTQERGGGWHFRERDRAIEAEHAAIDALVGFR